MAAIEPRVDLINPRAAGSNQPDLERFDLITFPEVFLTVDTLLETLSTITGRTSVGCVHVGLRPSDGTDRHLFTVPELSTLIDSLSLVEHIVADDIRPFRIWLGRQHVEHYFNVACLFAIDADLRLRVCLHPKVVPSQVETSPLPEHNMHGANFLTLVTLCPVEKHHFSVTLQPLICSDVLALATDQNLGGPMQAVNRHAACFEGHLPDHIDVVSVATCTPQPESSAIGGSPYREWHEQFQQTFKDAARNSDFARHHFSAIVLSNFRTLPSGEGGGLSGIFLPVPPPEHPVLHADLTVSCWGRPKKQGQNNRWSTPDDNALTAWSSRGFVAGLDPFAEPSDAPVKIFGFTIHRLPRDNSLWERPGSLTQCEVRIGRFDDTGRLEFSRRSNAHGQ